MATNHRWKRNERARKGGSLLALLAMGAVIGTLTACDLSEILEVEIPGRVVESALDDPALAQVLVNGVIAELECSWSSYTGGASHHSDEYMNSSSNETMRYWGTRKILADNAGYAQSTCGAWGYPMYTPLHTARFQGENVFERLQSEQFADVSDKTEKLATVRAYGAFPLIAFGEGFCAVSVPLVEGEPGPKMEKEEVLQLAETKLSEAITLAQQAGDDDILNMALVGRARARLGLEDFAGVIQDASQIPEGFLKLVTRDESIGARYNYNFERLNATTGFRANGTIADHYRGLTIDAQGRPTQDDGVPDPRVNAMTTGALCTDGATIHWFHDKYNSRSDPIPLASYKEAQMFMAEAYARMGQVEEARTVINARRELAGLPTFDLPATQDEMIALVIEERRREFFVEGGHRLHDMLRFRGTQFEIPFLGEPGSIHPNGVDQSGFEYGTTTCLPLPLVEIQGNPNVTG